jgi:hypothetical protein
MARETEFLNNPERLGMSDEELAQYAAEQPQQLGIEGEQYGPPPPDQNIGMAKPTDWGEPTNAFTNVPSVADADPDYNLIDASQRVEPNLPDGFGTVYNPETGRSAIATPGGNMGVPREPAAEEMFKSYQKKGGNMSFEDFQKWYAEKKPSAERPEDADMVSKYGLPPKGYPAHPFDREKFETGLLKDPMFRGQNPFKRNPDAEMEQVFQDNMERKFNEVFQGTVTWADRNKLTPEQMKHWESEALRYRAAIFNAAKADVDSQKDFWKYSMGEFDAMKKDYDTRMEKTKINLYRVDPESGRTETISVPRSDVPHYLSKRDVNNKLEGWTEGKPGALPRTVKEQIVDVFSPSANRTIKVPRSEADAIISGNKKVLGSEDISDWEMGKATKEEKVWVFDPADPDRSKRQVNKDTADKLVADEGWKLGQPTAPRDEPGRLTENQVVHELNNFALENGQDYEKMYNKYREFRETEGFSREESYRKTLEAFPKKKSGGTGAGVVVPKASASKQTEPNQPAKGTLKSLWR